MLLVLHGGLLVRQRESPERFRHLLLLEEGSLRLNNQSVLQLLLFLGTFQLRKQMQSSQRSVANNYRMILRKAGAALAAGCTMIVKPSPETPLSVLALAELAMQAGFPKGVFSVLTTSLENTPPLSEALCRHPLIKKVTFTGSVSQVSVSHWLQTDIS
jgi:hypothetical protein